jgi:hypothetical protein
MKALFAIVTCQKNSHHRPILRNTWLKLLKDQDYKFFVGHGAEVTMDDEVLLDCPDDYDGLPAKTRAIMKWGYEHGYDYICKVDDDVYVYPDRVMKSGFESFPYGGRLNGSIGELTPLGYCSGFTYWISKACARILAHSELHPKIGFEDVWVGHSLAKKKIGPSDLPGYLLMMSPKSQWHTVIASGPSVICLPGPVDPRDLQYIHDLSQQINMPAPIRATGIPQHATVAPTPRIVQQATAVKRQYQNLTASHVDLRTGQRFGRISPPNKKKR